jgi:hypothetical protein
LSPVVIASAPANSAKPFPVRGSSWPLQASWESPGGQQQRQPVRFKKFALQGGLHHMSKFKPFLTIAVVALIAFAIAMRITPIRKLVTGATV